VTASPSLRFRLPVGAFGMMLAAAVHAQSVTWPAATQPCNGTLQACVDAQPPGAEIRIDSDAPTNLAPVGQTTLFIPRALRLIAAPGRRPVFPAGARIQIEVASGAFDEPTALVGLVLRNGGRVQIADVDATLGAAPITLERMRFEHAGGNGNSLIIGKSNPGSLDIKVRRSEFVALGAGDFVIAAARAGTLGLAIAESVFVAGASAPSAIELGVEGEGGGMLLAVANSIVGSFTSGAIHAIDHGGAGTRQLGAMLTNNLIRGPSGGPAGIGIRYSIGEAPVTANLVNNTLARLGTAIAVMPRSPAPTPPALRAPL